MKWKKSNYWQNWRNDFIFGDGEGFCELPLVLFSVLPFMPESNKHPNLRLPDEQK